MTNQCEANTKEIDGLRLAKHEHANHISTLQAQQAGTREDIKSIKFDISSIKENHLSHIEKDIASTKAEIKNIKEKIKAIDTKFWAIIFFIISTLVAVLLK